MYTFLAIFITVAIGTILAEPTYEATAKILVKMGRENIYVPTMPAAGSQQNPIINNNREEQINSEIQILTSQALLEQVVETFGPSSIYDNLNQKGKGGSIVLAVFRTGNEKTQSPVKKAAMNLKNDLSVKGVKKSNVIEIRFKHKDPHVAAKVTNKMVELSLDRHLEVYKTPQSYKFFNRQSQILKEKLSKSEKNLEFFKREQNVSMLDHEIELLLTNVATLRTEINQTFSRIAETESRLNQLKKQLQGIPKTVALAEEFEASQYIINTLQGRLVELQLEEQELLTKYTSENRLVLNIREEINIVQKKLATHERKKYGRNRSGLNSTYQHVQEDLLNNKAELYAMKAKKVSQIHQLDEYKQRLDKLNRLESTLVELKRQIKVDQLNYNLYISKIEESRISKAMDTEKIANLTPIQAAFPPLKPIKPKKQLNMVLGFLLGIFGSLLLAILIEYLDDTLEIPEDAENSLSLPVLASVPELTNDI